jgi:hypothetical protein
MYVIVFAKYGIVKANTSVFALLAYFFSLCFANVVRVLRLNVEAQKSTPLIKS